MEQQLTLSFDPDQLLSLLHSRSSLPSRKQVAEVKDGARGARKKEGVGCGIWHRKTSFGYSVCLKHS